MSILTDGTLLAIQNMTWNGQLGFQSKPNASLVVDLPELLYLDLFEANGFVGGLGPQGVMGITVSPATRVVSFADSASTTSGGSCGSRRSSRGTCSPSTKVEWRTSSSNGCWDVSTSCKPKVS